MKTNVQNETKGIGAADCVRIFDKIKTKMKDFQLAEEGHLNLIPQSEEAPTVEIEQEKPLKQTQKAEKTEIISEKSNVKINLDKAANTENLLAQKAKDLDKVKSETQEKFKVADDRADSPCK